MNDGNPRMAEVLGVRVGQPIRIVGGICGKSERVDTVEFCIQGDGSPKVRDPRDSMSTAALNEALIYAINHPESVVPSQILTEAEKRICAALGGAWVSRDGIPNTEDGDDVVYVWTFRPTVVEVKTTGYEVYGPTNIAVARVQAARFPSVAPGARVKFFEE